MKNMISHFSNLGFSMIFLNLEIHQIYWENYFPKNRFSVINITLWAILGVQ